MPDDLKGVNKMKQITIKMNEKEVQLYKEARAQVAIESIALNKEKRIGTWLAEAIERRLSITASRTHNKIHGGKVK